jgi:hypothetical protein
VGAILPVRRFESFRIDVPSLRARVNDWRNANVRIECDGDINLLDTDGKLSWLSHW